MPVEPPLAEREFLLVDEAGTDRLGSILASFARPGLVIALVGTLGAGKTRLARAFAAALGVPPDEVSSPTYVLIHEYAGRLPIFHFDTYRLTDAASFDDLGAADYLEGDGVCLVEWADRVADRLPSDTWWVRLEPAGPTRRGLTLKAPAPVLEACERRLPAP